MQNLENFDFLAFRDVLLEIGSQVTRGDLRNVADGLLVKAGYYYQRLSVERWEKSKSLPNKEYRKWWFSSPKRQLVDEAWEVAETIGLIKFNRVEPKGPNGQWKTHYYDVIDDRSDFEILRDLLPNASEQEVIMILKIMAADKIPDVARIYESHLKTNITNDIS
jgi:hypothetical protein